MAAMTPASAKLFLNWTASFAVAVSLALLAGMGTVSAQPIELPTPGAVQELSPARVAELLGQPSPLGDKTLGKPGAAVTVVEYVSLGCPKCRAFQQATFPRFKKEYIDTGKVYFIYREYPIGKSSAAAAAVTRCVPDKHFFRVVEKFMNTTGQWNGREPDPDALYKVVQETKLTRAAFDTCLSNQKISDGVAWTKQRGRELGIEGTPTFFINGDKVRGAMTFEELQKLIEDHLQGRAAKPS